MLKKYKNLSIVTKASIWAFVASIVQKGISILATPIFTRILTTEEFGEYALYQSWHDILIIFISLNVFNYATYSAMKKYENDRDAFISTAQTLVTGLAILCFGIYYIMHIIYGDVLGFSMPIVVLMFFDILFFASYNLWCAKERYEFKYKALTIISIVMGFLGPILGVIAIHYLPYKAYGRIFGVAFVNISFGLCIYLYNLAKSKNMFKKEYIRFILAYCIPLIPHFLASQVLSRFDRIMISNMCSESEAGIYSLAYSLSTILLIVNDSILKTFTPWTYQTIKKSENLNKLKKNTNYLVFAVAIVNILLILFAPEAIKIFATEEYSDAIYIIPPVSASIYFMFLFNIFANIEYYYSETKFVAAASILAAVLNVILNYIFIGKYGYIAAGYTTLVCYIVYALCHFIFMSKVCKKHVNGMKYYDNRMILITSLVFSTICMAIIPLYKMTVIRYVIILLLSCYIVFNREKFIRLLKHKG